MKAKMTNEITLFGRVYQHSLELKTVQNKESANFGKEFITGSIDIATDDEALNIVPVHFTYVVEMTKGGKKNVTFGVLKSLIDGTTKTWLVDGKDTALKVRVNTALALNDFYVADGDGERLVSAKRAEGGFVNAIKDLPPAEERDRFKFDIILTAATLIENENGNDTLTLRGAVFNFRKDILPVDLTVKNQAGIDYFTSLDIAPTNPIFTEVRGSIINTVTTREIEEESAFGTASVKTVQRTTKEWIVDWAKPVEYEFGTEDTITAEELKEAIQNREVFLANEKKRRDEYIAARNAAEKATTSANVGNAMNVPQGAFNF